MEVTIIKPLALIAFTAFLLSACEKEVHDNPIKEYNVTVDLNTKYQTLEGFGAALAFYEGWLTAHPYKSEIYDVVFGELSLDILRVRNAYDYDAEMVNRVSEFVSEAEASLGEPIKVLSTSWGPPAYIKNNKDRTHGGTLKYRITNNVVVFDYPAFAAWWEGALNEYNSKGVYPDYISIQNEPDFTASYESCRFDPVEKITATDTIAGYNKALEAVYNMIQGRAVKPKLLGPETVGIGYNSVENYVNNLNTSYLYGIAHHLYHGVDKDNPWISTDFSKVGSLQPAIPHFQTEYNLGDWFSLAGLIYKSLNDENAVAYLYWDLIWTGAGLVSLDYPWDQSRWTTAKGYYRTKNFFVFKQFSAYIHPGWIRTGVSVNNDLIKALAFVNPAGDTVSLVLINRSDAAKSLAKIDIPGFTVDKISAHRTSAAYDCSDAGTITDPEVILPGHSITTVVMTLL